MDIITILGLIAGLLTTIAFFPQVIKVWKSRSTKDISLLMYAILTTGIALWIFYGFSISSLPVILANSITLILTAIILIFKMIYK